MTTIHITLNGESKTLSSTALSDLLENLCLAGKRYAVEINRSIVPKSQHDQTTLTNGDVIEVIQAVGGG